MSFCPTSTDGAQPNLIFNELCALKDEQGPCKAIKERFFFNVDTGRCELFEYGGCGGNANNFETLDACEETCVVSGESITSATLFEFNSRREQDCNLIDTIFTIVHWTRMYSDFTLLF